MTTELAWDREDRMEAAIRHPFTAEVSWSVSTRTQTMVCAHYRTPWESIPKLLRIYKKEEASYRDFPLPFRRCEREPERISTSAIVQAGGERRSCSIRPLQPRFTYVAVYGIVHTDRRFVPILHTEPFSWSAGYARDSFAERNSCARWLSFAPCDSDPERGVKQRSISGYRTDYPSFSVYTIYPHHNHISSEAHECPPVCSLTEQAHQLQSAQSFPLMPVKGRLTIFMFAWEYAPCVVGGLSRAVCSLSQHLATLGHTVHVITRELPDSTGYEWTGHESTENLYVHRVDLPFSPASFDFTDWVLAMNIGLARRAAQLLQTGIKPDLIHAHDGLVYDAASELSRAGAFPLAATIHSTEIGRGLGKLSSKLHRGISLKERKLCALANRIVVCSRAMESELRFYFHVPAEKIAVIPNGIDPVIDQRSVAGRLQNVPQEETGDQVSERENLIVFVGRLVYEKGIQVLIDAMQSVLRQIPDAQLIIAGTGPCREPLLAQASLYGDRIRFTGFVREEERVELLTRAGVCAVPSLYEPFGIVALEAMMTGAPLVVTATGGLEELVEHGITGYTVPPGDVQALADHIVKQLLNRDAARNMALYAKKQLTHYNWRDIACETLKQYQLLLNERKSVR